MTLDELLDEYQVEEDREDIFPVSYMKWAVSDSSGIIAYFEEESDAFAFRMMKINFKLNSN